MKRWMIVVVLVMTSFYFATSAEAADKPSVNWGKVKFEERHIGKVTLEQKTYPYKMVKGKLVKQKAAFGAKREFAVLKTIRQKNVTYYQVSPSLYIQHSKTVVFSKPTKTVLNQMKKKKIEYAGNQYISYLDRVTNKEYLDDVNNYVMTDLDFDGYPELFMGMEAMTSPELSVALTVKNH